MGSLARLFELAAAQSRHGVFLAHASLEAQGNGGEQAIAGMVRLTGGARSPASAQDHLLKKATPVHSPGLWPRAARRGVLKGILVRLLVYGMQSSGATAFTLFLAQRPDCLALVDVLNNFAAPRVTTEMDMVVKVTMTTAYPLPVRNRSPPRLIRPRRVSRYA